MTLPVVTIQSGSVLYCDAVYPALIMLISSNYDDVRCCVLSNNHLDIIIIHCHVHVLTYPSLQTSLGS